MTESTFTTLTSNNMEQVIMIAGDTQLFNYYVLNQDEAPLDLTNCEYTVYVFKYGDPENITEILAGSPIVSGSMTNRFYTIFSGSGLSGVYQQQVRLVDKHGVVHIPSQGKIIIFPSPE